MVDDFVGTSIAQFHVVAKIGEGGMGIVYRAIDEKLRRTVALKVLPEDFASDPDRRRLFLREARVAASVTHANLVTVFDVGEVDGRVYIAMELVEGTSLRHRLDGKPLAVDVALHIAKGIARGLAKAHATGVVHRDLKPDNVMVNDELEPKVLDFGLARAADPTRGAAANMLEIQATASVLTEEGRIAGTPGYMSPEQAAGRPTDARTDVFAFGVMLYEMLTGKRPFVGASMMEIIVATSRDEPPAPRSLNPDISPQVEELILRCIAKSPDARYPTAREILRELGEKPFSVPPPELSIRVEDLGSLPTELVSSSPREALDVRTPPPAAPDAAAKKPRARLLGLSAIALAIALGVFGWATLRGRSPAAIATASPSATNAAPHATTLTDLPLPPSKNAEAVSEYAAGMRALRDDSYGQAKAHFERAVALDDAMAMAHLHLAITLMFSGDPSVRRAHYAKAVAHRTELGERDQALLEAFEAALGQAQEERSTTFARLLEMSERFPLDVEVLDLLATMRFDTAEGLAFADRAIALDDKDAQAWEARGRALGALGRFDEARVAIERCTSTSLATSDCFYWLAQLHSAAGRCEEAERAVRRGRDRDPSFTRLLDNVMIGAGRSMEAVRDAMQQAEARLPEAGRHNVELANGIKLALLAGDFVRGKELATELASMVDRDVQSSFGSHVQSAALLTDLAIETGADADAFPIAWSFIQRSDNWASQDSAQYGLYDTVRLFRRATRDGGLTKAEFEARRSAWVEARRHVSGANPALVWVYGYAVTVETPAEAAAALAELPHFEPLFWFPSGIVGLPDAEIGHVELLAGHVDVALVHLWKAVGDCSVAQWPFAHMHAALDLGRALEQKGNTSSACIAYKKVIDRWGNAKPRSVTAEKAKERSRAIQCPG